MPKTFLKKTGGWTEIKSIFVKKTTGWAEVKNVFLKKTTGWVKVFTKLSLPDTTTAPSIRTTNTGSGTIYDGPVATSPQYLNADLFGKDGVYTNYTSIFGRKFTRGSTSSALTRTTIVNDDRFTSAGGVTTAMRTACDEQYLFYELTVQNGSSANEIYPISPAIKMIKSQPFSNSFTATGSVQVGATLTANIDIEYYYYNRPELSSSYVKWYVGNYAGDTSGTPAKTTSLSTAQTAVTSSVYTGSDTFSVTSAHLDKYITLILVCESSWTRHENYSTSSYQLDFAYAGDGNPVTTALSFSNVQVKDYYGNKGLDNRDRWPTGTLNQYTGTVSGWDSSTVLRIRYRVFNYDTFRYYKPSTGAIQANTEAGANAAWDSWNSNGTGNGYISDVTVSGSTATFYDYFDLSSDYFNGGGSGPTWWLEIELSAIKAGGTRTYYINPYETFYISKRIDPTVSVSPSTVGLSTNTTISGTFSGFPATPSTNAYPRQYIVYYGDGNDSGYLPAGEWANGTLNPTYSLTKSYSTAGTYTVTVRSVPYGEDATATVTVSSTKVPPTMGTPTISSVGAFISGQRRLSVPFTAVTNSGPSYQIYWFPGENYNGSAKPPVSASIDGSGTISPILDESGPNGIGRYAVWIRSSAANNTTGTTAPSTTLSDWSDLKYVYISGTRTLSYNKNTTDTVGSLPSSTSGTDPWDGWVTTVSSNTPTRTGHTFNGYNTAADGTGTDYAAGASITLTSDITLYAKWTANTYSVTYNGNGNTGGSVPDSQTKTHGVDLTLRTNVNSLTKTNFAFSGWNTNSSGTGTDYASGGTYSGNADLTLYAKWAALYTISFDSKGGTAVSDIQQSTAGGSIAKPTDPTKTGNTFGGWSTTDGGTTAVTWPRTPTSNETLYAIWTSTATGPGAPTSPSMGATTVSRSLTTSLTRISNTTKDQYWDLYVRATFTMTWTAGSGATSHEIYYSDSSTTPSSSTDADYSNLTTSKEDYWDYDTATTYYYWVRARNNNGTSAWVYIGSKTIPALNVTSFSIRIYRGNGSGFTNPSPAPAYSDYYYGWTGLTNRGNPSTGGEGHYAYVAATLNGTARTATSSTV